MNFRPLAITLLVTAGLAGFSQNTQAQTMHQLFDPMRENRFIGMRRHNDIHGAEAVFDDYRKNWLRRQNSSVMVGANSRRTGADTPLCDEAEYASGANERAKHCASLNFSQV